MKNIYTLNTTREIIRNNTFVMRNEFNHILKMNKILHEFYIRWAELKEFASKLSLMTKISGEEAKVR